MADFVAFLTSRSQMTFDILSPLIRVSIATGLSTATRCCLRALPPPLGQPKSSYSHSFPAIKKVVEPTRFCALSGHQYLHPAIRCVRPTHSRFAPQASAGLLCEDGSQASSRLATILGLSTCPMKWPATKYREAGHSGGITSNDVR
jgi:hypothetical protein